MLNFLVQNGLIPNEPKCHHGRSICSIRNKSSLYNGFVWKYGRCRTNISSLRRSIFQKNKITFEGNTWKYSSLGSRYFSLQFTTGLQSARKLFWTNQRKETSFPVTEWKCVYKSMNRDLGKFKSFTREKIFLYNLVYGISQLTQHECFFCVPVETRDQKTLNVYLHETCSPQQRHRSHQQRVGSLH